MTDDDSWWRCMMMIDDDSYDVWPMMDHDDDVRWWLVTDDDYDVWWWWSWLWPIWSLDNTLELWYVWSLHSMIVMTSRYLGRLREYHLHQLLFFSFYLHQRQLPHPAIAFISLSFRIQLLPANYLLPLMPKGERCSRGEMSLLGGAHPEGELVVSCHQWQRGRLLVSLSLAWFVWVLCCHWCQLSLWLRSCPLFRPFVEPLVCACLCVVWETFSLDSSPSLKPLGALEMRQKPLCVG